MHEKLELVYSLQRNPKPHESPLVSIVKALRRGNSYTSLLDSVTEATELIDGAGLKHVYNGHLGQWLLVNKQDPAE